MLEEHKTIVVELKNLIDAANKEKRMKYARFAEKLMLHTQTEEEVYSPNAILIGEDMKKTTGLKKSYLGNVFLIHKPEIHAR